MKEITVETTVKLPVEKVWEYWTNPESVKQWNFASSDWECPGGSNDLRVGGKFSYKMAAKDGSNAFDFGGEYDEVEMHKKIVYHLGDGRKVAVVFLENDGQTKVTEVFEIENVYSEEQQRSGWQAILDNFKKYCEATVL